MTGRNTIHFGTKRDFQAFGHLVRRSGLGNKEPGVVAVAAIPNRDGDVTCDHDWKDADYEWHACENVADVRIVRNHAEEYDDNFRPTGPAKVYSDAYCIECLQRELHDWLEDQLALVFEAVVEARDQREQREVSARV